MPPQPSPAGSHKQSLASVRVQLVQNLSPAHVTKYPTSGQNSSKFLSRINRSPFSKVVLTRIMLWITETCALPCEERSYQARKMKNLHAGQLRGKSTISMKSNHYTCLISFKQKHMLVQFCVFSKIREDRWWFSKITQSRNDSNWSIDWR